ncbi:MAG TPA: hypothetical protein VGF21_19475 [Thermoleophilaceae bacterium]|jgi:hypothetical protein
MTPTSLQKPRPSRTRAFALVAGLCLVAVAAIVVVAALGEHRSSTNAAVGVVGKPATPPRPGVKPGSVLVRAVDKRDPRLNGPATMVPLAGGRPRRAPLSCERIALAADGGICLQLQHSGVDWKAVLFDSRFRVRHKIGLTGVPSRARVSPDGRYGAYTTFVTGDSYAHPGTFSTRTKIVDMHRGTVIADLEQFKAYRGGDRLDAPDVNYWGVTFSGDPGRFYATLATHGKTYLVAGNLRTRRLDTLRENVECPSLSPDGRRIAFKKRVGGPGHWRLHVLDLKTLRDHPLSERRSIDDQVEWLDNRNVLYGDGHDVYEARADGGGSPRRLLARADSPTVQPAR